MRPDSCKMSSVQRGHYSRGAELCLPTVNTSDYKVNLSIFDSLALSFSQTISFFAERY